VPQTQTTQTQATPVLDPGHSGVHFSLGQIFTTALLGLAAYEAVQTGGASIFLNPTVTGQFMQGIISILHPSQPPAVIPAATPVNLSAAQPLK
jgi:hypothetical protein